MSVVFLRGNCLLKDEDYDYDDEGEPLLREGEGLADEVELFIITVVISGETLCRDNCQLIGMPFFHTRSAGKNNRN